MNRKIIVKCIGTLLCIEAVCMTPCMAVALIYRQGDAHAFIISIIVLLVLGFSMRNCKPATNAIDSKDGLAIVGFGWLVLSAFGTLPFLISGAIPSFVDALFETISGFTTTGASILREVESLPKGILFWRSFTHWVGGMGVLVLMLAIMPSAKTGNVHLMNAESPGPSPEKFVPHIGHMAKILYCIYALITLIEIVFLLAGKMSLYDALIHAFGTAGTGGFSNKNASVAAFNSPYIEIVITVFMLLFGVNFSLYYGAYRQKFKDIVRDEEFRFYFGIVFATIALITLNTYFSLYRSVAESLRHASFQVGSIITTTGYASTDFTGWPVFSQYILVLLMFVGASAGSTGGGIKCVRILLLLKVVKREIDRLVHPNAVKTITLNGKAVDEKKLSTVLTFFFLYLSIAFLAIIIVSLDNMDMATSATAVFATISNIGPGLGAVGPAGNFADFSAVSKMVMSLCMIIGRLEIYPILVLLTPTFWKRARTAR